jgi:hypothetical protein
VKNHVPSSHRFVDEPRAALADTPHDLEERELRQLARRSFGRARLADHRIDIISVRCAVKRTA